MSNLFIVPEAGLTTEQLLAQYGQTISLTLNAELNALLESSIQSSLPFNRGAGAGLDASVRLFASGGMQLDTVSYTVSVTNTPGETLDLELITRSINLTSIHDWSQPLGVNFSLQGRATTFNGGDSVSSAEFNALNSLGFANDGPVFDLPDGFTVFAPELNIVDNRWTDPRNAVPPSPIPLPAGLPLLLAGFGALCLIRRRASKKVAAPPSDAPQHRANQACCLWRGRPEPAIHPRNVMLGVQPVIADFRCNCIIR